MIKNRFVDRKARQDLDSLEAAIANGVGGVSGILPEHAQKLQARIEADMGIKAAILGDSTEAGSGARGGNYNPYGELGDKRYPTGQERFILNLMYSSPYWLPPTKDFYEPNKGLATSYGTTFQWPTIQLLKSENPSYSFTYPHKGTKRNTMTIVYFRRYADAALTFDVVCGGVTTTIDTYKAPQDFGTATGKTQTGWDIEYQEVTIPTDGDTFSFVINNAQTVDRGSGAREEGAAVILGFYYGKTVGFKNLAVSSSTLLNASEANLNRGITTDDRMQAAFDYGANVFFIGWGTNDSKPGISTVAAYKADLATRIDEIRAEVPDAIIILNSDPLGATGSEYENNASYYAAMKEVAVAKNCSYFDIMNLLATFSRTDVVADDVHPNQTGYDAIGLGYSQAFGVKSYVEVFNTFVTESRIETVENKLQSNFFSELIQNSIWSNISSKIRVLYFNAQSGTTIADKSGNSGDATLSVDAATLAPTAMGFLRTLTLGANDTWQCADAADLSFGDGAGNDEAFSIIWFGKINLVPSGVLVGKRDMTTDAVQAEYQLFLSGGEGVQKQIALTIFSQDGTAYIGRKSAKSSTNDATEFVNDYNTYIATYDGSKAASGIKLYQNGVQIDNEDYVSGSYTGMTGGTAPLGNFRISAAGEIENNMSGTVGLVAIVKAELSAVQVAELDALIRSAYGLI